MNPFGPKATPTPVRFLLWTIFGVSIVSVIISQFFGFFLTAYLSLSPWGILQGFIWQFITYFLVVPGPLSFFFALYLLFVLYLIWVIGTSLIDLVGARRFLTFFFVAGILAGACGLAVSFLTNGQPLAGATPVVYALLVSWAIFFPNMQVLFFFVPIKTKWLVIGLLALTVFLDLGSSNWVPLAANLGGALVGLAYTKLVWRR